MRFKHIRFKALVAFSIALAVLSLALLSSGRAVAVNQLLAQGYSSNANLQPGMIVRLDNTNANSVTALDQSHITGMLGVVITANEAALTLSQPTNANEVYVSNYGQHDVLVTNQNGPISTGNYITISSLSGLGMKADNNESEVLGQAAATFDGTHNVLSTAQLTSSTGRKSSVAIGLIPVDLNIAANPLAAGAKGVPTFLSKITKFASNKSVSATRVYLSMLCVVAGVIAAVTIIYSGVKNGIISLGRNPLARGIISGGMVRVIAGGILIFAISLGVAYTILR